jgi:dienelactone hydrolase
MNVLFTGLAFYLLFAQGLKEKVTFESDDGVVITADHYQINKEYPYILLFHQAGSSRGEFNEIAEKLMKLRYNCLAVDLRSGDNSNFIRNETAISARELSKPDRFLDASRDIRAAIDFAYGLNPKEVILFGSSYSASLVLLEGEHNGNVKATIAFSPGEYFGDDLRMESSLDSISKPVFVAVTQREYPYVSQMMSNLEEDAYTLFQPEGDGVHGARALWEDNASKDEYWLALLLFINNLNQ